MTVPEVALWQVLRTRPGGHRFRRQHPIGPYVVDFCCLALRLVVEIDGAVHNIADQAAYDLRRTGLLEENGFIVVRIAASRVLADACGVAAEIVAFVESPLHRPTDGPPPRTGED